MRKEGKKNWLLLLGTLALPLAVGGLSALLTADAMKQYASMNQPPLAPPAWVFPVVWTILYLLMGYASYLVLTEGAGSERRRPALVVYAVQLGMNFFWTILFFRGELYFLAFLWLAVLWAAVLFCAWLFYRVSRKAGALLIPYVLWNSFALYLNYAIYQMSITPMPIIG